MIGRDGATAPLHVPFALTEAQSRMLQEVCRDGVRAYNGRAQFTINRLRMLGLVQADLELVPHATGGGTSYTQRWTVRPNYVAAFCSWCSRQVTKDNRCARIASNGRMYQFDSEACRAAFDRERVA